MHEGFNPTPDAFPRRQELAQQAVQRLAVESTTDGGSIFDHEATTVRPIAEPAPESEFTAPAPRGRRNDGQPGTAVKAAQPAEAAPPPAPEERPVAKPEAPEAVANDASTPAAERLRPESKQERESNSIPPASPDEPANAGEALAALAVDTSVDEPGRRYISDRPLPPEPLEQAARPAGEAVLHDHTEYAAAIEEIPTVTIVEGRRRVGEPLTLREATPEEHTATLQKMERWREVVQETLPEQDQFVSPEMDAFFEAKGLQTSPVYVLDRADIVTLTEELGKAGYANKSLTTVGVADSVGVHLAELNASIVVNTELTADDPILLQSMVAHEMAHGTNRHNDLLLQILPDGRTRVYYKRIGLKDTVKNTGDFPEEAFAASTAAEYLRDGLHLPNGLWRNSTFRYVDGMYLPPIYVWPETPETEGWKWVGSDVYPAVALDLLKQVIPTLSDSLVLARSSEQGLLEVADAVNEVEPLLYDTLDDLPYTERNFRYGLHLVQRALGTTIYDFRR